MAVQFTFAYNPYLLTDSNPSPEAIACVYLYSFLEGSQSNVNYRAWRRKVSFRLYAYQRFYLS